MVSIHTSRVPQMLVVFLRGLYHSTDLGLPLVVSIRLTKIWPRLSAVPVAGGGWWVRNEQQQHQVVGPCNDWVEDHIHIHEASYIHVPHVDSYFRAELYAAAGICDFKNFRDPEPPATPSHTGANGLASCATVAEKIHDLHAVLDNDCG